MAHVALLLAACASKPSETEARSHAPASVAGGAAGGAALGAGYGAAYGLGACLGTGPMAAFCVIVAVPVLAAGGLVVGGVAGATAASHQQTGTGSPLPPDAAAPGATRQAAAAAEALPGPARPATHCTEPNNGQPASQPPKPWLMLDCG